MTGFPVTIVDAGGYPVTDTDGAAPAQEVESGGYPITLVEAGGLPLKVGRKVTGGASGPVIAAVGENSSHNTGFPPITLTLPVAPQDGDLLIAVCMNYAGAPTLQAGWTAFRSQAAQSFDPTCYAAYKYCSGEGVIQTPFVRGSAAGYGTMLWQIRGVSATWASVLVNDTIARDNLGTATTASAIRSTAADNQLSLFQAFAQNPTSQSALPVPSLSAGDYTQNFAATNGADAVRRISLCAGHKVCETSGTSQNVTVDFGADPQGWRTQLLTLALL